MFCPRCGQQQLSQTVRFCSRCGFQLDGVLAMLEQAAQSATQPLLTDGRVLTKRQRGMRKGIVVMCGAIMLKMLTIVLGIIDDDFFALLVPVVLIFAIGFMRWLYAWLLEADTPVAKKKKGKGEQPAPPQFPHYNVQGGALPPAYSAPVANFTPAQPGTNEMSQPPSVTEGTTRVLDEKLERR
jgi:hypothetical protein